MGLIVISGGICLFQRLSPLAYWSHLFGNINREMELAQKDCSENGDDGWCEPSMVSAVFTVPGLPSEHSIFVQSKITK